MTFSLNLILFQCLLTFCNASAILNKWEYHFFYLTMNVGCFLTLNMVNPHIAIIL
ncbi:hypothetical protein C1646_723039 [Rhizophagus diaphanus]|nr:hypothetical protein C1646_723039 [Rhizophagus diaphanus] [Rhizophagus sp. MUCL 43196]